MSTREVPEMWWLAQPGDGRAGERSRALFAAAQAVIPGGVNSPVRAFRSVGGDPPFIRAARGAHLLTEDGAVLIDYVGTWGPAILGHAHPAVIEAVARAARDGLSFGACSAAEVEFAELLCQIVPALRGGMVRLVSSGTEATMSALRLARGFTGRAKIVKIDGGYHGHADMLLVAAGSGAATLGIPGSAGVPAATVADTLTVPFNSADAIERVFAEHPQQVAAVVVEPVAGNMGCVPPRPGYLEKLRALCSAEGAVLIFDEVMTGFRVALGGAGARYGVVPDLVCLGKIVGGGMPVGAYGGRREILQCVAPLGPVYQAGTLSGNPVAVAAGLATLHTLVREDPYPALEARSHRLVEGIARHAARHGVPLTGNRVGAMFTGFFRAGAVDDYDDAKGSDTAAFARFHGEMLARGVYLAPSQFEAGFLSTAHDDDVLDRTLAAADEALARVAGTVQASAR
jgi:glutamate-1-semialdehyde 2,1-aminomutase